jgi:hypothetical protein
MAAASENKRRFMRRHCTVPIELRTHETPFPLFCEATDISFGGCYVRLINSLRLDVDVDIVLCLDGVKLSFRGTVRTADTSVGNGIEFTGINEEQRSLLIAYLDVISATAKSDFIR